MEKLEKGSLNIKEINIEKLKNIFPECIKDGKIDFDILKCILGEHISTEEQYSFNWVGKKNAIRNSQLLSTSTLVFSKQKSFNSDNTKNIYIEGDNLETLKVISKTYHNKVDMIYIDPPYNTGKDFIYHDDYTLSFEDYINITDQNMKSNPETSGKYHTDWLNMIYPRLLLSKHLLKEDGIIFISIDDNELANLTKVCNEIFGESNCVAILAVEMSKTQGMKVAAAQNGQIVKNHEYVLMYANDITSALNSRKPLYEKTEPWDSHFDSFIKVVNGFYQRISLSDEIKNNYAHIYKEFEKLGFTKSNGIDCSKIGKAITVNETIKKFFYEEQAKNIYQEMACSINVPDEILKNLSNGAIIEYNKYLLNVSSGGKIRQYRNLYENLHFSDDYFSEYCRTTIRGALWKGFYSDMMNVSKEGNVVYKNGKKPIRLMKQLAKWINRPNGLYLDFFAGSCSTAHAILDLNAEDGGTRKYIMIQLPQNCEDDEEARKEGFKNLCDIGEERLRRCSAKILEILKEKKDEAGIFENESIDPNGFDAGFKVFTLTSSNIKPWDGTSVYNENDLLNLNKVIKDGRADIDVAYEIMLKYGVFDKQLVEKEINGKTMYSVDNDSMIISLIDTLTNDDIMAIIKLRPSVVVFKESCFEDDNAKINVEYTLRHYLGEDNIKVLCL